jgi:hypothetical protein
VGVSFRNVEDDSTWAFAGLYGPNIDTFRRSLREELAGLFSWWDLPWWRFQCHPLSFERLEVARFSPVMTEFSNFISKQGLMDLPLARGGGGDHVV